MKIHLVRADLFHAGGQMDGQKDRGDGRKDDNSHSSQFCEHAYIHKNLINLDPKTQLLYWKLLHKILLHHTV